MALQVLKKEGIFYLKGKINTLNSRSFIILFEHNIRQLKKTVVNIDSVVEIDKEGMKAIRILNAIALKKKKMFSIIGFGSKQIYDDLSTHD
ncbi:hypothetical protein [Tenacibaculum sp. UWU-22]|uniref:hypothetical protein n=1 Tax=Tenacibaculum sp. UWU-22 TaxID=3234187 RepID=UPI0034DAF542